MANNYIITTNAAQVRQSATRTRQEYARRAPALAGTIGAAARDNIRDNIRPRGQGGVFPGYAITGALASKVVNSAPVGARGGWLVTVRVQLTGKQARYARIHETGGKIPIRSAAQIRAMFASLRRYGQLGKPGPTRNSGPLRYITIRRKAYFARGMETTRRQFGLRRLRQEF